MEGRQTVRQDTRANEIDSSTTFEEEERRTGLLERVLDGVPALGDGLGLGEGGHEEEDEPQVALRVLQLVELCNEGTRTWPYV